MHRKATLKPNPNPHGTAPHARTARSPTRPTGEVRRTGEVGVYCDCCPHRPKKMAVIQPDAIQIIGRRSGKKHIVRIPFPNRLFPTQHSNGLRSP